MNCQKCKSERVADISGWCQDRFTMSMGNEDFGPYYVPYGVEIGGGDELGFKLCLDCGQIQGKFPVDFPEKK